MVMDRHRVDPQFLGEPPYAEDLQTVAVGQCDGRIGDAFPVEPRRHPPSADHPRRLPQYAHLVPTSRAQRLEQRMRQRVRLLRHPYDEQDQLRLTQQWRRREDRVQAAVVQHDASAVHQDVPAELLNRPQVSAPGPIRSCPANSVRPTYTWRPDMKRGPFWRSSFSAVAAEPRTHSARWAGGSRRTRPCAVMRKSHQDRHGRRSPDCREICWI
ncbi:hypothetical protein Srut_56280 [Streptomyces rutgersensis]|nr:hypothetical protein Srut_56280 [Streptomyces rutgersensis]